MPLILFGIVSFSIACLILSHNASLVFTMLIVHYVFPCQHVSPRSTGIFVFCADASQAPRMPGIEQALNKYWLNE